MRRSDELSALGLSPSALRYASAGRVKLRRVWRVCKSVRANVFPMNYRVRQCGKTARSDSRESIMAMSTMKLLSRVTGTFAAAQLLWCVSPVVAQGPAVRDSSGVSVIEHPRLPSTSHSRVHLDALPAVEI